VQTEYCPDLGPICLVRPEPAQVQDQRYLVSELRAGVERTLGGAWAVEVQVPVRMTRSSIAYRRLDGTPFVPDWVDIHHRSETIAGLGDPWLFARHAWRFGAGGAMARVGATLPFGDTVADPFALGDRGQTHQHVQHGSGVVQPITALAAWTTVSGWRARAHLLALWSLYANVHGNRPGQRVLAGVATDADLGAWRLSFGADLAAETAETWNGEATHEGNVGRIDLLGGFGVGRAVGKAWRLAAQLRVPLIQHVDHEGLTYPAIVELRADWRVADE